MSTDYLLIDMSYILFKNSFLFVKVVQIVKPPTGLHNTATSTIDRHQLLDHSMHTWDRFSVISFPREMEDSDNYDISPFEDPLG
jgi:hypothetical protein